MGNAVDILYHKKVEERKKQAEKERIVFQSCLKWTQAQEEKLKREAAERRERRKKEKEHERMERDRIIMEMCLENIDKEKRSTQKLLKQREDIRNKRMKEILVLSERRMKEKEDHIKRESEITKRHMADIEKLSLKSRENTKIRINFMEKKKEDERKDFIRRATTAEKTHREEMEKAQKRIKSLERKIVSERMLWQQKLLKAKRINGERKKTQHELWTIGRDIVEKRKLLYDQTHDDEGNTVCTPRQKSDLDLNKKNSVKENLIPPKGVQNEQNKSVGNTNLSTVFEEDNPILGIEKVKMTPRYKIPVSKKYGNNNKKMNRKVNMSLQRYYVPRRRTPTLQDNCLKLDFERDLTRKQNAKSRFKRECSNDDQSMTGKKVSGIQDPDLKPNLEESNQEPQQNSDIDMKLVKTAEQGENLTGKQDDSRNENTNKRTTTKNLEKTTNVVVKQVNQKREIISNRRKMAETSPKPDNLLSVKKYTHGNKIKWANVNASDRSENSTARKKQTEQESERKLTETEQSKNGDKRQETKGEEIKAEEIETKRKEKQVHSVSSANKKSTKSEVTRTRTGREIYKSEQKLIAAEREQIGNAQSVDIRKSKELYRKQVVTIMDPSPSDKILNDDLPYKQSLGASKDMPVNKSNATTNIVTTDKGGKETVSKSSKPTIPIDPNKDSNRAGTFGESRYGDIAFNFSTMKEKHITYNSQGESPSNDLTQKQNTSKKIVSNRKQSELDKTSTIDPRNGAEIVDRTTKKENRPRPITKDYSAPPNTKRTAFLNKPSVVQRIEEIGKKKSENKDNQTSSKVIESEKVHDMNEDKNLQKIKIPIKSRNNDVNLHSQVGLFVLDQKILDVQRRIERMTNTSASTEVTVS